MQRPYLNELVLVCLKRVTDHTFRVRVAPDSSRVITDGAKSTINPFDEIALEEALRLKERGAANEVVIATVGPPDAEQQLRTGLAMGADRAILVETSAQLEPLAVARALRALVEREQPKLVLLGKQTIDGDNNQTGQMLAALWQRPQATFASKLEVDGAVARVTREVDAGLEIIEIDLPAVVTTDLRLNQPRYVKLPEILKAKSKRIAVVPLAELRVESRVQFNVVRIDAPPRRAKGVLVKNAAELVELLRQKGLV